MIRALVLTAALLIPSPVAPASVPLADAIPKVVCPARDGQYMGTAFYVGPHLLLTARHISANAPCFIDGEPMHVTYTAPNDDYAVLSDDRTGRFIHADCQGFVADRQYAVLGHGRGVDTIVRVDVVASGETYYAKPKDDVPYRGPYSVLRGMFEGVPGQSGGPIVDAETGDAVGIVSAADWENGITLAVPLSDTPVCKKATA